jgi:glycosyltransferase involved in cell wall biosynthesis
MRYLIVALLLQPIIVLWVTARIAMTRTLILHAHDFNTLIGSAVARWLFGRRIRLIYDSHELTPGVYEEWYGRLISRIAGLFEFVALRQVDAIVAANDAILRYIRRQCSAPAAAVYNSLSIGEVPKIPSSHAKKKLGLSGYFVTLFTGKVRQDYDIEMILDAAREIKRKGLPHFKFLFTGYPETMKSLIETVVGEDLQGIIDIRGWVSEENLSWHYAASDLCFAVTRSIGTNSDILTPIKLFESMAFGVPVIVRDGTLAADLVRRWGCGIAMDVERTELLTELTRLSENRQRLKTLGEAGRKAFLLEYNWDLMQGRLLRVYREVSRPAGRTGV